MPFEGSKPQSLDPSFPGLIFVSRFSIHISRFCIFPESGSIFTACRHVASGPHHDHGTQRPCRWPPKGPPATRQMADALRVGVVCRGSHTISAQSHRFLSCFPQVSRTSTRPYHASITYQHHIPSMHNPRSFFHGFPTGLRTRVCPQGCPTIGAQSQNPNSQVRRVLVPFPCSS